VAAPTQVDPADLQTAIDQCLAQARQAVEITPLASESGPAEASTSGGSASN